MLPLRSSDTHDEAYLNRGNTEHNQERDDSRPSFSYEELNSISYHGMSYGTASYTPKSTFLRTAQLSSQMNSSHNPMTTTTVTGTAMDEQQQQQHVTRGISPDIALVVGSAFRSEMAAGLVSPVSTVSPTLPPPYTRSEGELFGTYYRMINHSSTSNSGHHHTTDSEGDRPSIENNPSQHDSNTMHTQSKNIENQFEGNRRLWGTYIRMKHRNNNEFMSSSSSLSSISSKGNKMNVHHNNDTKHDNENENQNKEEERDVRSNDYDNNNNNNDHDGMNMDLEMEPSSGNISDPETFIEPEAHQIEIVDPFSDSNHPSLLKEYATHHSMESFNNDEDDDDRRHDDEEEEKTHSHIHDNNNDNVKTNMEKSETMPNEQHEKSEMIRDDETHENESSSMNISSMPEHRHHHQEEEQHPQNEEGEREEEVEKDHKNENVEMKAAEDISNNIDTTLSQDHLNVNKELTSSSSSLKSAPRTGTSLRRGAIIRKK